MWRRVSCEQVGFLMCSHTGPRQVTYYLDEPGNLGVNNTWLLVSFALAVGPQVPR